uniref:Uncharacterized protein n=1 Tax=Clytia hemisphaerica TaxID=252671 RepID=A0A7M5WIY2_9CNID
MRLRLLVLLLALALCLTNAKPLTDTQTEESPDATPEKKDNTPEPNTEQSPDEDQKSTEEVDQPSSSEKETSTESQPEEASESESTKEVEESNDDTTEGAKKTEVPNKDAEASEESSDDVADTEDNTDDAAKRDFGGGHEGGGHHGDEGGHEGQHGHHEHDNHHHGHQHHDHGYEFYEEWGEHGGHEGEHHGHHEGGHHGEHGHHHGGHHGGGGGYKREKVDKTKTKTATPQKAEDATDGEDASKKWWLVGDHWGGWGHSHWGHPHAIGDGGGWQWGHHGLHGGHGGGYGGGYGGGLGGYGGGYGGYRGGCGHGGCGGGYGGYGGHGYGGNGHGGCGHGGCGGHVGGHYKSKIPDCCKSKDPKVTKRCGCHLGTTGHGGYHFSDHGSGHDNHDHRIQGPWSFGYDHFGDDWSDWDHNTHSFRYLTDMTHLPHDDHCGHGRACVPLTGVHRFSRFYPSLHFEGPAGNGFFGGLGGGYGGLGGGYGGLGGGYGGLGGGYGGLGGGYGAGFGGFGLGGAVGGCGCNAGGCGCGPGFALGGGLNNYGVYGHSGWPVRKFDNYRVCHKCHDLPSGGSRCLCKSVRHHPLYLPVVHRPAHVYIDCDTSAHKFGHNRCYARADIPTPEEENTETGAAKQGVFYPYANYGPWSAYPWWGDWWGGHGHHSWGEGHGQGHGGGCGGCGGCGHHAGGCRGRCSGCGHHGMGRNVGFSFGRGAHLQAYHCKDQVEKVNGADDHEDATTKRFCVPIGYNGGYGFPYFHGYPGVGTGLWGWGWPWIKNKVPGSKLKEKKVTSKDSSASKSTKDTASKDTKKSAIPRRQTKKQTIHVGYGYASGDNYRLGYGMGGMGGVAGFTSPHGAPLTQFARSRIPAAESTKDVTGTKRNMAFSQEPSSTGSMLGHPVTHPGFTTMGFPGHADSSIEAQKSRIPKKL